MASVKPVFRLRPIDIVSAAINTNLATNFPESNYDLPPAKKLDASSASSNSDKHENEKSDISRGESKYIIDFFFTSGGLSGY